MRWTGSFNLDDPQRGDGQAAGAPFEAARQPPRRNHLGAVDVSAVAMGRSTFRRRQQQESLGGLCAVGCRCAEGSEPELEADLACGQSGRTSALMRPPAPTTRRVVRSSWGCAGRRTCEPELHKETSTEDHHLIVGGQRSCKSRHAERLALQWLAASPEHRAIMKMGEGSVEKDLQVVSTSVCSAWTSRSASLACHVAAWLKFTDRSRPVRRR